MLQRCVDLIPDTRSVAGAPLNVVVVSPDGTQPPNLSPFSPRVVTRDMSSIRPSDDVVVLYSHHCAHYIESLRKMLGRAMPAVLVVARGFAENDVIRAFDNGATGYLLIDDAPQHSLMDATRRTAAGESCLSPRVATLLLNRMYPSSIREIHPVEADVAKNSGAEPAGAAMSGKLTARQQQIMDLLATGHMITEISAHLGLTEKTVRNNLSIIYDKLQVRRQSEAILLWLGHERKRSAPPARPAGGQPALWGQTLSGRLAG